MNLSELESRGREWLTRYYLRGGRELDGADLKAGLGDGWREAASLLEARGLLTRLDCPQKPNPHRDAAIFVWNAQHELMWLETGPHYTVNGQELLPDEPAYRRVPRQESGNADRDKWIYEQCVAGKPYKEIRNKLSKRKRWAKIGSDAGIRQNAIRYARNNGLPQPPKRTDN